MEETDKIQQKLPNQEFDYFKIGKILLSRWYWIAAAVIICYIAADVYLWYTPKTYVANATIKLEEPKTEITDLLGEMTNTDKSQSKVQSEMYVMQSRGLILDAVKALNYPVSFYLGRVRAKDLYPQKPLDIKIIKFDTLHYYSGLISFQQASNTSFTLNYKINGKDLKKDFLYNHPVSIDSTVFIINSDGTGDPPSYTFKFNAPNELFGRIKVGLTVGEAVKGSGIVYLRQTDGNPQFASDVLNEIMDKYLIYDRIQKQQSASQIITFIDDQLDTVKKKVKQAGDARDAFKKDRNLMDVTVLTQSELTKATSLESQIELLKIQLKSISDFKQQVLNGKDDVALSFNIEGGSDPGSATLITTYNKLLSNKNYYLQTYVNNSPPIKELNRQIASVKKSLLESIELSSNRTSKKIVYLQDELTQANNKLLSLPAEQGALANLDRDYEVNEKVYTFLSEKKLDAQISRSAVASGVSIVEKASPNFGPLAPDEHTIKRTAILFGLIVGLGLIVLIRMLNPYIYDKETIESLTTIPIIGVIRKFPHPVDEDNDILVLSQPKSVFAESVRSVRTNLSFLAAEKENKVICITSEVAGEGKSFVAVNLSSTLSLIDKKIILIAADLRRSKLHKTFHIPNDIGLSNYLANQATLDDIILHTNQDNFDFIPSGPVPPNPSELLHTNKMKTLIDELKLKYDIVMVDTAPVGLVSDSIPLVRMSDINVFVIRSGKSKFYSATIPQRIDQEYQLNNSVIILNAFEEDLLHSRYYTTKFTGDNQGTRYYYYSDYVGYESSGYYMDSNKKKWWDIRRWFK